ncbi:MAG: DUF6290 family protein [Nanoarchaeota archaeon]
MAETVTTRVPKETLEEIDKYSKEKHMDRATMLRNLIEQGLEDEKKEKILQQYKNRKISLQKATELLKIDLTEMLELVKREDLHLDYTEEELREDLKGLR